MAYQKTTWINNSEPGIDAQNLNKIEQGIYDNSVAVDTLEGLVDGHTVRADVPSNAVFTDTTYEAATTSTDGLMSSSDFTKLSGIGTGAQANVQSDWSVTDNSSDAYIKNKPTLGTASALDVPTTGNASTTQVVKGDDTRLTDSRPASDVSAWAKGSTKPSYSANEVSFSGTASGRTADDVQEAIDEAFDEIDDKVDITIQTSDDEPYSIRHGKGDLVHMNLVGGTIGWNQQISNGDFADGTGWSVYDASHASLSVSDNVATLSFLDSGTSYRWGLKSAVTTKRFIGHKVFVHFEVNATFNSVSIDYDGSVNGKNKSVTPNQWSEYNLIWNNNTYSVTGMIILCPYSTVTSSDSMQIKNVQFIDLTLLFGSTIADYIYTLEQNTSGAGVAFIRKYFPNTYYEYNAGQLLSVNPSGRRAVGKNLFDSRNVYKGYFNQTDGVFRHESSSYRYRTVYIPCWPNTTYTVSKIAGNTFRIVTSEDIPANNVPCISTLVDHTATSLTITTEANAKYLSVVCWASANDTTLTFEDIEKTIQIEIGATATDYEPPRSAEYIIPQIELRGIPKLVDGKLNYDGDVRRANGTVVRNYGIIDLGSLTWTFISPNYFSSPLSACKVGTLKLFCIKGYTPVATWSEFSNASDKVIHMNDNLRIYIKDAAYSDKDAFKAAMNGVYLVYELDDPVSENAPVFANPQMSSADGIEEWIDSRDVVVPVGNNSIYYSNETYPPVVAHAEGLSNFLEAMKVDISALGTDESGNATASRAYLQDEYFYKDGKMYKCLTAIASGATFTVGTNCSETTLFAELTAALA